MVFLCVLRVLCGQSPRATEDPEDAGRTHVNSRAESYTVTLVWPDGRERSIRVSADQHIWDAAHAVGIELPALCHQGWCLTCAGKLEGPGEVDQRDSVTYYAQDRAAGFVLLCTGKPCSDLRIQVEQARAIRTKRRQLKLPAPYANL